jgi:hypothetical protein
MPSKTKIVPSKAYEAWGPAKSAPALLRCKDGLDPWEKARSKYSKPTPYMDADILKECSVQFALELKYVSLAPAPWEPKVFNIQDAVSGVEDVDFWNGIPRNTSSGYPYCTQKGVKGKTQWFGSIDEYEFDSVDYKELENKIYSDIESMSNKRRQTYYYVDYLKDERRAI